MKGRPDQPRRPGERGALLSVETGGNSTVPTGGDGSIAFAGSCFKCCEKGHRVSNCTVKRSSGCKGRHHIADVCPTSGKEDIMAVPSEVGARDNEQEARAVQASLYEPQRQASAVMIRGQGVDLADRRRGLDLR